MHFHIIEFFPSSTTASMKPFKKLFQLLLTTALLLAVPVSINANELTDKHQRSSKITIGDSRSNSNCDDDQACMCVEDAGTDDSTQDEAAQQDETDDDAETFAQGIVLGCAVRGKAIDELGNLTLYDKDSVFQADLDTIVSPYFGDIVSTADLRAIKDKITLLYLQKGYITSWVDVVELQTDGTLVIHVTEGFIQDVNVGLVGETQTIYVPTDTKKPDGSVWALGENVSAYLAPALLDEDGIPQRPVNLSKLEDRLQLLSQDRRFAFGEVFSRLRVPTKNLWDRAIDILQPSLNQLPHRQFSLLTPEEVEAAISNLENQRREFNSDTVEPGSSVLEIDLKILGENAISGDHEALTPSLASSTANLENRRDLVFRNYFGREFERTIVDSRLIRFALHSLELQEPSIQAAVVYIASEGSQVSIRVETAYDQAIEIENIAQFDQPELPEETFTYEDGEFEETSEDDDGNLLNLGFLSNLIRGNAVERVALVSEVESFWRAVQDTDSDSYLRHADQLYDLLIRSIENEFEERNLEINTLLVAMDSDLGLLPLASLYDSETRQYLAEKYKLALIPNFRSLDIRPSNLSEADILAMGASEFRDADQYAPLSAVPLELSLIENIWGSNESRQARTLRNEDFTLDNLRQQRRNRPYPIVHLASHANFRSGLPGDSSIQLWDTTLPLNQLQLATLNFNNPPLELLVLSACQTALGSEGANLGFAGSFLQLAEVKSVLASLWYVNDLASLIYMMEFYRSLRTSETKAEAVQNTQLAMLDEQRLAQDLKELNLVIQARLDDTRYLESLTEAEKQRLEQLSAELNRPGKIDELADEFTHPFYWSAYTLVGNPW